MTTAELLTLLGLGLGSGFLGGLLGIGGSIVMIPVLTLVLGPNQHLYQAAAMIVNVAVALPSALRHGQARAIRWDVVFRMLPLAVILIVVGVAVSDVLHGNQLRRVFGLFLVYVIYVNIIKLMQHRDEEDLERPRPTWPRAGLVGGIMGFAAGLLGIGGGVITVPLLQRVCHLPLRQCIASSSAVMCLTAVVGAIRKNMTLAAHPNLQSITGQVSMLSFSDSLLIAICLTPTAIVGGLLGAEMTHRLPLRWIRVAFIILMLVACLRMLFGR